MFTGLIQEVGRVKAIKKSSHHIALTCACSEETLQGYQIGDSMAVNGVCLTAIAVDKQGFTVEVMPETFAKTTLSQLQINAAVNLERAMLGSSRFEGHIVAGHVDTVTRLIKRTRVENSLVLTFHYPSQVFGEIVPQGSIAINGTSLTVSAVTPGTFSVSLIPHSMEQTNLDEIKVGNLVNIETDVLAKYVKAMLGKQKNQTMINYLGEIGGTGK